MAHANLMMSAAIVVMGFGLTSCGNDPATDGESATSPTPSVIEERQANFKSIGKAFKQIRTQLEGGSPDMAAITTAAGDMNSAALNIQGHFPTGTSIDDGFDTEALASIWEKPEDFAEATKRLVDASAQMMAIAEGGDVAAVKEQVGAIGGSCKNCHDNFRLDTD